MKYRKKPVIIEAIQFDGANARHIETFFGDKMSALQRKTENAIVIALEISTLEGTMRADKGDWIIRGVKGEFYPCKPDIFEATYELAE